MNVDEIIAGLQEEKDRIESALAALNGAGPKRKYHRKSSKKKRTMSAKARKAIGAKAKKEEKAKELAATNKA